MSTELRKALAYWQSKERQPKAKVYTQAIEARIKGEDTDHLVTSHELANAISRGASGADAAGLTIEATEDVSTPAKKPARSRRKAKGHPPKV